MNTEGEFKEFELKIYSAALLKIVLSFFKIQAGAQLKPVLFTWFLHTLLLFSDFLN